MPTGTMPYSDDIYSPDANYSDGESMHDELSPADGFFERDGPPLNAMVPDPSQSTDDKAVEDKVLIKKPEPQTGSGSASLPANSPTLEDLLPAHSNASAISSTYGTSSPSASNPPPRSFNRAHPDALIMSGLPPPPAYTPSPSSAAPQSLPSPESTQASRSYNTFGDRSLEHHLEQGFIPPRQPETMGRPEEEPNEATPLAGVQSKRTTRRRAIIAKILFVALVLTVMSSIVTALLRAKNPVRIAYLRGSLSLPITHVDILHPATPFQLTTTVFSQQSWP